MWKSSALFTLFACALATVASADAVPSFEPTTLDAFFLEQFTEDWESRWKPSRATKETNQGEVFSYVGEFSVEEPLVYPGLAGDRGLVLKSKAAHHAISVPFPTLFDPKDDTTVIQYEVKMQDGLECGGAYLKVLTARDEGLEATEFSDKTPYTIMFGPDKCGATQKVHFIIRHKNPVTGEISEHHLTKPPTPKISKTTTLYTLIVKPDQTFDILINEESVRKGSLLEDLEPPINPPKMIADPEDSKPADWVEEPKIPDATATKPADWDEDAPEMIADEDATIPEDWLVDEAAEIADPDASQPEDWDEEFDGEYLAPMVPNPKCALVSGCGEWKRPTKQNPAYKGKWIAPLVDNPAYKGIWKAREIPNPGYFQDLRPSDFAPMSGLGLELWSMTKDILFDNILITDSPEIAQKFAAETFAVKRVLEEALESADKPVAPSTDFALSDLKNPQKVLQFARAQYVELMDAVAVDGWKAVLEKKAVVGTGIALVTALFTIILTLLSAATASKPTATKKTKPTAVVEKPVVVDEVKPAGEAAVTDSTIRKRTAVPATE